MFIVALWYLQCIELRQRFEQSFRDVHQAIVWYSSVEKYEKWNNSSGLIVYHDWYLVNIRVCVLLLILIRLFHFDFIKTKEVPLIEFPRKMWLIWCRAMAKDDEEALISQIAPLSESIFPIEKIISVMLMRNVWMHVSVIHLLQSGMKLLVHTIWYILVHKLHASLFDWAYNLRAYNRYYGLFQWHDMMIRVYII